MSNVCSSEGRSMLANAVPSLLQHVRRLAATASSDEQLLADFLARRSDEAFAALIGRHGPMVLNVCRRVLHDAHAAEDVFQATFLVLADRAAAIRRPASLAGFLHGVAYRLAVRARQHTSPKRKQGMKDALACASGLCAVGPPEELAWKEMLGILDHELARLPDRYRAPLVLCYLDGRTQDEAARQLGWGLSTLRRRLAQGRHLLEARLRGRGVTLPAALAGLLAASAVAVPGRLRAATLAAAGARAAGGATVLSSARKGIGLLLSTSGKKVGALVAVTVLAAAVCFGYVMTTPANPPPAAGEPPPAAPAADAPRGDLAADPLPAGAAVRLGTGRYRHGTRIESFAVSADGKLAVTSSGWGVYHVPPEGFSPARVFDLTDGRCLYSLPNRRWDYAEAVGLSPDGKTLAVKDDTFLTFRDAATGKEIRKIKYESDAGGGRSITDWLTFTPDGKRVAVTLLGNEVQLLDVGTGKVVTTFPPGTAGTGCVFSPDGKRMAAGGYDADKEVYFARIWEVGTGKELAHFPAARFPGNGGKCALAFSPDGAKLAGGGWGDGRLHLWDAATGKELTTFPKIGSEVQSIAFAPDGKTVAAAADSIHLYDPNTGKERFQLERRARGLAFSRDGSVLTGAVSGAIYRWDVAGGWQLTPGVALDSPVQQILASADGRSLFTTNQDGDLHVWDPAGGKAPRRIAGGIERGVAASPDGRFLAWAGKRAEGGSRMWLYDIAGRRVIDRFGSGATDDCVAAFLPDGKALLTLSHAEKPAVVRLWDVESGKKGRSFAVPPSALLLNGVPVFTTRRAALSPDGKTLAIGIEWEGNLHTEHRPVPVCLWDVATGKPGHKLDEPTNMANVPDEDEAGTGNSEDLGLVRVNRKLTSADGRAFSPDGRFLVDWAENPFGRSRMDHVCVWDAATGRAIATLLIAGQRPGAANAAFAPDGRTLATASADGTIRLWEVATWKVRAEFRGHRDRITALAFAPDGLLFSGGLDTTVLGWDVRPPRDATKGTLAEAWDALAGSDAKTGLQAQGRFLAEPGKAVEWFASRLTPAVRPDPARVKTLIADLDSEDFATRERATAELKEYGAAVAAALRAAVAKSSAEARRRAEGLLREIENGVIPPRELRALRAVEVLEWIATPEARAVVQKLTKGAPDARLTREAAATGKRLTRTAPGRRGN
jgi:RNA polymerase sigma factor (sigma-70 family)